MQERAKMKKYLFLLAGSPGTGKTYLMERLFERFPTMYRLTLDEVKEYYAESIGFDNLAERAEQEKTRCIHSFIRHWNCTWKQGRK